MQLQNVRSLFIPRMYVCTYIRAPAHHYSCFTTMPEPLPVKSSFRRITIDSQESRVAYSRKHLRLTYLVRRSAKKLYHIPKRCRDSSQSRCGSPDHHYAERVHLLLPPTRLRPSFFAIFFKRLDKNQRNFRSEHLRTCSNFHYLDILLSHKYFRHFPLTRNVNFQAADSLSE